MTTKTPNTPAAKPQADAAAVDNAAVQEAQQVQGTATDAVTSDTTSSGGTTDLDTAGVSSSELDQAAQLQASTDAPDAKHRYQVASIPIRHDGDFYEVGQTIGLTAAQAERLGSLVVPLPETLKE